MDTCSVKPQHFFVPVLICLVLLLGLFLNIFSIYVFMYRMPEWRSGTLLQFNLAVSDLLICLLAPFITTYFALKSNWPFGIVMCKLQILVTLVHYDSSILFLTFISIHRYVSVVYHSQDSCMKQKKFVRKLCIGIWVALLLKGVVCCAVLKDETVGNETLCMSIHQKNNIEKFFILNFIQLIPGFLMPFSASVFCYSLLARSVSGININHQKGKRMKSKSSKMVAICLIIFALCFFPLNVVRTVLVVVGKFYNDNNNDNNNNLLLQVETTYYFFWILSLANCCLDPLIYCFASQNFTKAVRNSLRKIGIQRKMVYRNNELASGITMNVNTNAEGNTAVTHIQTLD